MDYERSELTDVVSSLRSLVINGSFLNDFRPLCLLWSDAQVVFYETFHTDFPPICRDPMISFSTKKTQIAKKQLFAGHTKEVIYEPQNALENSENRDEDDSVAAVGRKIPIFLLPFF